MKKTLAVVVVGLLATSCVETSAMRVSKNEIIIQTSAEAMCGSTGALRAAEKQAAIETIKAGYDRYVIVAAAASSNVYATQMPGTYNTSGHVGPYGHLSATTTYTPGPMIIDGTHDQSVGVRMFREGEPGAANAISAREVLGPKWQEVVKKGVHICSE